MSSNDQHASRKHDLICMYCSVEFPTPQRRLNHEVQCTKRYLSRPKPDAEHEELGEPSTWGANEHGDPFEDDDDQWSYIPTNPGSRSHLTQHDTLAAQKKQVEQERSAPQAEALGYNARVLQSMAPLSEAAKSILRADKDRRRAARERQLLDKTTQQEVNRDDKIGKSAEIGPGTEEVQTESATLGDKEQLTVIRVMEDEEEYDDDDDDEDTESNVPASGSRSPNVLPYSPPPDPKHPPIYVAYIDLLSRLMGHKVDLSVFDEVIEWAIEHSQKDPGIFVQIPKNTPRTRAGVMSYLRRSYHRSVLAPTVVDVKLPSGRIASMPVYDFEQCAREMLLDPKLSGTKAIQQENFDPITWRPRVNVKDNLLSPHDFSHIRAPKKKPDIPTITHEANGRTCFSPDVVGRQISYAYVDKKRPREGTRAPKNITWRKGVVAFARKTGLHLDVRWEDDSCTTYIKLDESKWFGSGDVEGDWLLSGYEETEDAQGTLRMKKAHAESHNPSNVDNESLGIPVGDMYTGSLLSRAIEQHAPKDHPKPSGVDLVRPLAVNFFIDKSHQDKFGALAVTPVSITFAAYPLETRRYVLIHPFFADCIFSY